MLAQQTKDEVFSLRFTKEHANLIKSMAVEEGISPTKAIQNIVHNHIEVMAKCFKRPRHDNTT